MDMKLKQLRFFVAVAEELHFSRAAKRLCMTQPPLSQAILALEQELGVPLFRRTKRRVELTSVGEHLLPHARKLLEDAQAIPDLARRLADGDTGELCLGFVTTTDYSILPDLVNSFAADYPDVTTTLREMTSDLQIEALLQGEIGAGLIIPLNATLHASLTYLPLISEPLVAAVPEKWIGTGRLKSLNGKVKLEAIANESLILFPREVAPAFHDSITSYFATNGRQPKVGQEAVQMQTIISLVSSGMGVALVPGSLQKLQRAGVRYLALEAAPPVIETGLVWKRDNPAPTVKHLVEAAKKLCNRPRKRPYLARASG